MGSAIARVLHPRANFEELGYGFAVVDGVVAERVETVGADEISLVERRFPDLSMYFGGVQAALWDPLAGFFETADSRRSGGTAHGG